MTRVIFYFALISVMATACTHQETVSTAAPIESAILGSLEHKFELNEATREKFEEGLLLLHNFEYDDALTTFKQATAIDSTEVMTHWGEAMSHYKALWRLQDIEKGQAILNRFGETPEKRLSSIDDPLEKDLWQILEIMYQDGDVLIKNKEIAAFLSKLHQKYPAHQEIAAFYALSLIWATEEYGDGSEDLKRAAVIADSILLVNPNHPGALHYKIHALDGPTTALEAHAAADAYAQVAADAAHALHMPSHIYLAVGEWDGVVQSNRASYDASVERMKELDLKDGARGYHSLAWLHYGLLQQGRYKEAEGVLQDMIKFVPRDPTKGARGYLLGMQSRQIAEAGQLSPGTALDTDINVDDIGLTAKAIRSFTRAQVAFTDKNTDAINQEIKWLSNHQNIASDQIEGDAIVMCAAGPTRYAPTENDVKIADVIISQMRAMNALINDDSKSFKDAMQHAVSIEDQTNYPTGPPRITKPSFEQYGEWQLSQKNYDKAIALFNKSLDRMPRRTKSLQGKWTALKALGKNDKAQKVYQELETILSQADKEVRI